MVHRKMPDHCGSDLAYLPEWDEDGNSSAGLLLYNETNILDYDMYYYLDPQVKKTAAACLYCREQLGLALSQRACPLI